MPITVSLVEPNIYRGEWVGDVSIEDVVVSMKQVIQLADEMQCKHYVLLVDLAQAGRIPFDIRNLLQISNMDKRVVEFIVIEAPTVGQVLGNMLRKLSNQPFSFANSLDKGVVIARDLIHAASLRAKNR